MITTVFQEFLTILVGEQSAQMLSEPIALLFTLMLLFLIMSIFLGSSVKKPLFIVICIVFVVFATFSVASSMGMVVLPVTLGGIT